jgi:hypothetical protein
MKAKLTDEASKSALAKLSGWSDVAGDDVASRVIRMSFSHRSAPLGPTVELQGFGVKQLCAKICTRKPAPNPLVS